MNFMTFTEINEKLIGFVKNERQITHEILNHILLFQKCNGHLKLGYSSMHQYLTRGLGYSDDQAYRRLKAARLINELPEVADQFQTAKLNLSQMAEAQKAFETSERENKTPVRKEIKANLILSLEKASNFQTKSILTTELKLKPNTEEKINPQSDQTVRLELSLTEAQFEKIQIIKNLISHQIPDLNTGKALEMLCDFFISKKQSVSAKANKTNETTKVNEISKTTKKAKIMDRNTTETSEVRETEKTATTTVQTKATKTMTQGFMDTKKQSNINRVSKFGLKRSRYIPVAIKNAIFEKSQGCCEYIGSTGIRCNSRYQVQIDHQHQAFCFGGENTIENLRNLCAQHNRLTAQEQGIGFETTSLYRISIETANKK